MDVKKQDFLSPDTGDPSLLQIILDLNPYSWALLKSSGKLIYEEFMKSVLIFINTYLTLKTGNKLYIIAGGLNERMILYPTQATGTSEQEKCPPNQYKLFRDCNEQILMRLKEFFDSLKIILPEKANIFGAGSIVCCMSQALIYADSVMESEDKMDSLMFNNENQSNQLNYDNNKVLSSRILVISASPGDSDSSVSLMNCVFSAQRMNIVIDVLKLSGTGSDTLLMQAAYISGGIYRETSGYTDSLQTLMGVYLIEPCVRNKLNVPENKDVDLRAACFCHKNIIDYGYCCSLCFSGLWPLGQELGAYEKLLWSDYNKDLASKRPLRLPKRWS